MFSIFFFVCFVFHLSKCIFLLCDDNFEKCDVLLKIDPHMLIAGLFCCNEDEIVEIEKNSSTWIGECCDIVVGLGNECMNYELLDKVPTRSIIVQETVVNAILTDLAKRCNIDAKEFVKNHPGGTIGAKTK